jgi:hypothetical protein
MLQLQVMGWRGQSDCVVCCRRCRLARDRAEASGKEEASDGPVVGWGVNTPNRVALTGPSLGVFACHPAGTLSAGQGGRYCILLGRSDPATRLSIPEGCQPIAGRLSGAIPPVCGRTSMHTTPEGVAAPSCDATTLPGSANSYDTGSGGVAALHHRLIVLTPSGVNPRHADNQCPADGVPRHPVVAVLHRPRVGGKPDWKANSLPDPCSRLPTGPVPVEAMTEKLCSCVGAGRRSSHQRVVGGDGI